MNLDASLQSLAQELGGPILGMDTSTPFCVAALIHKDGLEERSHEGPAMPSDHLAPMIERLFQTQAQKIASLKAVVVGIGPGSFTGLRVALGLVKGLALCDDLPLFPQSSLLMLAAAHIEAPQSSVQVALDARRGDVFFGDYAQDDSGTIIAQSSDEILPSTHLENLPTQSLVLDPVLHKHYPTAKLWTPPSVKAGIFAAKESILKGKSAQNLLPSYLRVSEAERQTGIVLS